MEYDRDKVDEMALALLYLTTFEETVVECSSDAVVVLGWPKLMRP